ncbi:type I secretion system permease/ATPase [Burkholderia gladioli]|uniref:type I secretion system permease/ATPase n=1 Tax=Burkholderia gladioli TaxID=28095 RepID=UPI003F7B0645
MGLSDGPEVKADAGLSALLLISHYHGIVADPKALRHAFASENGALSDDAIERAARNLGLKTRAVKVQALRLTRTPLPAIALDREGKHFVLAKCEESRALIVEAGAAPSICSPEVVIERCAGRMLLFTSRESLIAELAHFDFTWFIPAVVKHRRTLLEVLSVSLILQLFGLVSPLMFQVVMDKVLVSHTFSTLNVVCVALFVCGTFEVLLGGLRTYVFSHTTNAIDAELGARLYRHLLALPLGYFASRRVGDTVARIRELENIRNFLTGQALTAIVDILFSVVFFAVMFLYSVQLTLVVLCSLPIYLLMSACLVPVLRARLDEKFARGADNQSFLLETVTGVETLKAMAVEPHFIRRWETSLAAYISAAFNVTQLANVGQQLVQYVGKLVSVITLFLGAKLVIDGRITVGGLVAFNMMSQHVAGPILRLAQLWQDFQQVGISMKRLADILNVRTEIPSNSQTLPVLTGAIQLDHVRFRYRVDGAPALDDVSLAIAPGQLIGIVGRSGSGKSTLTKLLQRLYVPEQGTIRIDGVDLAFSSPAWLRRQIGVVLQENYLFNRTVRDNIALAEPSASIDLVVKAATLAGAHEFICQLPNAYDTVVGERGASLSGGQRQRLALARALLTNPKILILDEATSALDYETEQIIRNNMTAIRTGRTVITIAHRLSTVREADRIFVMDRGRIVEDGSHDALVALGGYYARLVNIQNGRPS